MPSKFVGSIGRTLDARPDRLDLRDREFTPALESLPKQFPKDEEIREFVPQYCKAGLVLDQGEEGACTGFGLACVVNYLLWRQRLKNGLQGKQDTVSPRMLYHLARFYDEWPGEDYEGSSCRGALKAWQKHGVCAETLWPYRDANGEVTFIRPKPKWAEDALQRRLGVYYRVTKASVVDMQAAIVQIGAIYVSSDVHDGWGLANGGKALKGHASLPVIRSIKKKDSLGGHAFALVGFNRTGFVVQNSWGEDWGNLGFGVLPYEEWVQYGADAWACALGVPALEGKSASVPVRNKERVVLARAGGISFTTPAKSSSPPVSKAVARWSADEAYRHTLVMGNDGLVVNRIVTLKDAADAVQHVSCDWPAASFGTGKKPKRLVVYAHGGLNAEEASVDRIRTLAPYFKANGTHPVFLTWRTGPLETLSSILDDELKKVPRPEGDAGEVFDRIKETVAEALDRTIEVLARPAAKPIWSQMKQNAAASIDTGRGCWLLAAAIDALLRQHPDVEVHFVGHSAGSIILGHLLEMFAARSLKVASCHLYAPACTVRFALKHYVPAIDAGVLDARKLHLHVLSYDNEICDTVGPYKKSLLYLVSRALETCHKMPILGLEEVFVTKSNPKWNADEVASVRDWQAYCRKKGISTDVVTDQQVSTGTRGRMIQSAHGSFDNDATTIGMTLKRITGSTPAFAIENIEY
jgi:pimeloyl-ACP methyl ester carboxylesterase